MHERRFSSPGLVRRGRGSRGAATAEAVVALPVLILLFVSLEYFGALSTKKHELMTEARSCAWLYSAGNCTSIPAGCEDVLRESMDAAYDGGLVTERFEEGKEAVRQGKGSGDVGSGVLDMLLAPLTAELFGRAVEADARAAVKRPALYGGGEVPVAGRYHLACNLRRREPLDVVLDAWSSISSHFF